MNDFLKVIVYGGLFTIPFLTLYVANDYFFPFITGKNFAFRILVETVFVAWAVLCLLDVKYRPKFSWVVSSFSVLLIVMFFANLFGQHPQTSFWSNFERMDGYVTLVHVFLYMLVLGSVLTTKSAWDKYLHATLVAATITAFYGLAQNAGIVDGFEPGRRIESYLGNAAYLSIYMLFHIFIAFWMFVESKVTLRRVIYALLAVMFTYVLLESGTRGTALGLATGVGVMAVYIVLFGAQYKEFRRYAIGALALMVLGVGGLLAAKDSDFVQNNISLARIANIDLGEDLKVRGTIWGMAWDGVKERPVLGWGQGNFNYIFNEQYKPFLYNQEQWFDRAHNIILDWLVAGGFLGLLAYLSIFVSGVYYLLVRPIINKADNSFTVLERGVLLGILAGYMTHNLVVFDNIVSYMFFGLILAMIHSRVGAPIEAVEKIKMDRALVTQFVAPVAGIILVALVYTMQLPGINAAEDIIAGYQAATPADKLAAFKRAVERDSFAQQEIAEQVAQQAMAIARTQGVDPKIQQEFLGFAESELLRLANDKPGDARIHVFIGSFYRAINDLEAAAKHMDMARELSPMKQSIIAQQAIVAYSQGNMEKARDLFGEAYRLDERNDEAREFYAGMLFLTGDSAGAKALIQNEAQMERFAMNDFLLNAATQTGDDSFLIEMYKLRLAKQPEIEQNWASLAFLYGKIGDTAAAVATLREAATKKPGFAKYANCVADNLEAGKESVEEGCR